MTNLHKMETYWHSYSAKVLCNIYIYYSPIVLVNISAGHMPVPTRSRGISRSSDPCLRKTLPALCAGLIPMPSIKKKRKEKTNVATV